MGSHIVPVDLTLQKLLQKNPKNPQNPRHGAEGCSQFANLTWWADVLNETGRGVLIEGCLQGGIAPGMVVPGNGIRNSKQRTMCEGRGPGVSDCPYHVYRTSDDISLVGTVF